MARKQRTFVHYLKNGNITKRKPTGCTDPTKGTKIKVAGQPDARVRICRTKKPKTKKSSKKGKGKGKKK